MLSRKHQQGKGRLANKVKREKEITELLKAYDREHHPVGETLPDSVRLYRIQVVTTMLKAGVALNKLDKLLEENALLEGKYVSVLLDGTTHVCKALAVVLRFVDSDWEVQQRVCRHMLLSKSMTGEETAR